MADSSRNEDLHGREAALTDAYAHRARAGGAALLLAMAAAALCACGVRVTYTQVNRPPRAVQPRPGDKVEVFMSQPPARPFVEVGMLEARQESTVSGDSMDLLTALREEAGRQGCEAIFVTGASDKVVGAGSSTGVMIATLKGYRAVCIVFK